MKKLVSLLLVFALIFGCSSAFPAAIYATDQSTENTDTSLSSQKLSSIAMLNYMTVLSEEISASANSKVFLDETYNSIVNNINPNAVDDDSMTEIEKLLDTISAYQSVNTKQERLNYLYEQNQAASLKQAIPNPMSVLNVVQSGNPLKMLLSVVYLAVDSVSSYESYMTEADNNYLEDSWKLEDSAKENLDESRSEAFKYMVTMCRKNNIEADMALNEDAVEDFVKWENNDNITRRVDYLESNQSTYQAYGRYWIVLAESYYELGAQEGQDEQDQQEEYQKCLQAIQSYEELGIDTFRRDYDYAEAISYGLVAARNVYSTDQYIITADKYLPIFLDNINTTDWAMKYYAAEAYVELYGLTKNTDYLQKAYDLADANVNQLIDKQQSDNKTYLAEITKKEAGKNDSKEKKKEVKAYNEWLTEQRKTELAPVYEPLVVNCELLFDLADKLNISAKEQTRLDNMLHGNGEALFLVEPLEEKFYFSYEADTALPDIEFDGTTFTVPANLLEYGSTINVTVKHEGESTTYDEWTLEEVDREKKGDIDTFSATFKNKPIKKQKYSDGDTITLKIIPPEGSCYDTATHTFKVSVSKKLVAFRSTTFEMVS